MDHESKEVKRHKEAHKSKLKTVLNQLLQSFKISRSASAKTVHKTMDVENEYVEFLQHIDFRVYLKNLYPELIATFGQIRGQIDLTGSTSQVENAIATIQEEMRKIRVKQLTLSQSNLVWNIVAKNHWSDYFTKELIKENIKAKVCSGELHSLSVVACSPDECARAFQVLFEILKEKIVPVRQGCSLQSIKFQSLISKLEEGSLIQIVPNIAENSIKLFGIEEDIARAEKEISSFLEEERISSETYKSGVSQTIWNFFARRVDHKSFQEIEKDLEQFRVSITITDDNEGFLLRGQSEGIEQCKQRLSNLMAAIIEEQKTLEYPGLKKLFLDQAGKELLRMIEMETHVDITIAQTGKKYIQRPVPLPRTFSLPSKACIYDVCNFMTKEGIKVSWNYGKIENEMADVLVNCAYSNINNFTACGKAMMIRGGLRYEEACKLFTDVHLGDVAVSESGDLLSKYVIHAVCYDPNRFKEKSPTYEFLQGIMRKILEKCRELEASSLAMPMIDAEQIGCSEELVLQVIRNEVNHFSSCKDSGLILKNIRVIVLPKPVRRKTVAAPNRPRIISSSFSDPGSTCATEIVFGAVRILLCLGSVMQYEADTMMNISSTPVRASKIETSKCVEPPNGCVQVKSAALNNIKHFLYCVPVSSDNSGLERATKACLDATKFLSLSSIMIPAMSVTSFGVTPNDCADIILKASERFSNTNYAMIIRVLVFDEDTILVFKRAFEKKVEEQMAGLENVAVRLRHPKNIRVNIGGKDEVTFRVFGLQDHVSLAISKIEEHVNRNKEKGSINDRKIVENLWIRKSKVKELLQEYEVLVTLSPEEVIIEGMKEQVLECMLFLKKFVEREKEAKRQREICESVQWSYSAERGIVLFDEILNGAVESALREDKKTHTIPGTKYEVNLTDNFIMDRRTGHRSQLTRRRVQEKALDLPAYWELQRNEQDVHLVTLSSSSQEYQKVIDLLGNASGLMIVQSIERIQNPRLYKLYLGKKESMGKEPNEKQLFHATKTENIQSINMNNFNRRFSGINGTKFGHGVYFARDALYSVRFSQANGKEKEGPSHMFVAKVLVGKSVQGEQGMRVLPKRNDPLNPELWYDSAVNDTKDPSIFVTFDYHQCYPEYLITFTTA